MNTPETNHAIENANAWMQSIREMVAALDATDSDLDAASETIEESVLSVEVRSGWHAPGRHGRHNADEKEYRILLTAGGPALRIIGALNASDEPAVATLEYQDWGTPWTAHRTSGEDDYALLTFARVFYFGD